MRTFEELIMTEESCDFKYYLEQDAISYAKKCGFISVDNSCLFPMQFDLNMRDSLDRIRELDNVEYIFVPDAKLLTKSLVSKKVDLDISAMLNDEKNFDLNEINALNREVENLDVFKNIEQNYYLERHLERLDNVINNNELFVRAIEVKEIKFSSEKVSFSEFIKKTEKLHSFDMISDLVIVVLRKEYTLDSLYVFKYLKHAFEENESKILMKKYDKVCDGGFEKYTFRNIYFQ